MLIFKRKSKVLKKYEKYSLYKVQTMTRIAKTLKEPMKFFTFY